MAKPLIQDIVLKKKQTLREPVKKEPEAKEPSKKKSGGAEDEWDKSINDAAKEEKKKKDLSSGTQGLKFPRLNLKFPRLKLKFKIILSFVLLAILIFGGIIILNKFSSIVVEITPRQEFIDVDAVFSASVEPQKDELPLEVMQLKQQEEGTAVSTGIKQVSRKASGRVMIYNAYTSQPQSLVAGTRLETPDGKIYRLDKSIIIPGAKIEEGKITPSEIEVTVYADKPGAEYNIGLTDFIIPGFKDPTKRERIYGRSKTEMTGGFVGDVPVVTENDINNLDSSLKSKIQDYLLKNAVNPRPEELLFYNNAKQIIFDKEATMPKVGEETSQVYIKESAALLGFLLGKNSINQALAEKYFDRETAQQIEVINAADLDFELKKFTATSIVFNLKGKAHFIWKIDEAGLKADLIKESKNPNGIFPKYSAIEKAKIVFKPGWWHHIPKDPSKIAIQRVLKENP